MKFCPNFETHLKMITLAWELSSSSTILLLSVALPPPQLLPSQPPLPSRESEWVWFHFWCYYYCSQWYNPQPNSSQPSIPSIQIHKKLPLAYLALRFSLRWILEQSIIHSGCMAEVTAKGKVQKKQGEKKLTSVSFALTHTYTPVKTNIFPFFPPSVHGKLNYCLGKKEKKN